MTFIVRFGMFTPMKQEELRILVRNAHQNPFRVCMTDGKAYTIRILTSEPWLKML